MYSVFSAVFIDLLFRIKLMQKICVITLVLYSQQSKQEDLSRASTSTQVKKAKTTVIKSEPVDEDELSPQTSSTPDRNRQGSTDRR